MRIKILVLSILILTISFPARIAAQEEKFIGLFIYNFTRYFDWPESTKNGDFIIQVIGHESVYNELLRLTSGKKVGNQNFVIKNYNSAEGIGKCSIVFLGHWHSKLIADILNKFVDSPTLIITEADGMLNKGSCINFLIQDGSIKFEMSSLNVQKKQLKTDPRIRELALRVVD